MTKNAVLIVGIVALLAACSDAPVVALQGYGEADYTYLASQEAGIVQALAVQEGDDVEAGAPIARLAPDRLAFNAETAGAQLAALREVVQAARADADLARRNLARSSELSERGFMPRAHLDADRAARDAADARLAQARRELNGAEAQRGLARARLGDLSISAPRAGRIERIFHREGEVVAAGAPIAALLAPENMKVRFFAPQAMLAQFHVGDQIGLSCDGCPVNLTGRIIRIATEPQFTPPVIFSLEQREKLVFLIEARPEQAGAIHPGLPVDVRLPAAEVRAP